MIADWLAFGCALAVVATLAATARSFDGGVPEALVLLAVAATGLAATHVAPLVVEPLAAIFLAAFVVVAVRRRDAFRRMRPRRETAQHGVVLAAVVLTIAWLARGTLSLPAAALAAFAMIGSIAGTYASARKSRSDVAAPYRAAALEVESVGPSGLAPAAAAALVLVTPAVIALASYEVAVLR